MRSDYSSALLNTDDHLEQAAYINYQNQRLEKLDPRQRIQWALKNLPGNRTLSSSFGIQSAVMLHMVTTEDPTIPVILIDTGYLFPETYQFIDQLQIRLRLNLKVLRPELSPAWQEARFGKLWEQGIEGIESYNKINKVAPMLRALNELEVQTWFAGLRREQSQTRRQLDVLRIQDQRFKVHPIIDWSNKEIYRYLQKHKLPYHPLWEQGYTSVGDAHTSQPLSPGMRDEETRFFGLKRECGLHE
ncbi:MAG TPA: phosphoadenylyl-sulfate reductase [Chromatiales bacterium]|nr:phosphoadenylyl-sulfate reductase [Thiotrichales bacterium]HIP69554.1 phosphoadenylyl-sulfate reductase [Chromatiales bacterium]